LRRVLPGSGRRFRRWSTIRWTKTRPTLSGLQVHLVGTRPWDPYSKAKYLHHLRTQALLPFSQIVDFCGGRQKDVLESINAYSDMEKYYRPVVPDDGSFDTSLEFCTFFAFDLRC
jgi:hypothetical protein